MPRLKIEVDAQQLNDDQLRKGLAGFVSDDEAMKLVKAMGYLMKSGDLGFWLSPRLVRKIKALTKEQQGDSGQSTGEIDEELFFSFLQQGGSMEPSVRWEIEFLPNNGRIYKFLTKEDKDA